MVLTPFSDKNRHIWIEFHYVTVVLIVICALVFVWQVLLEGDGAARFVYGLGMIPVVVTGDQTLPPELFLVPSELTLVSSSFSLLESISDLLSGARECLTWNRLASFDLRGLYLVRASSLTI